ncbi:hypothetical protein KC686_02555, partial [Candidatus Woesebacteria bacterium]|nr:hypothetical protein [Candidatus Woesebacteria bacterium]
DATKAQRKRATLHWLLAGSIAGSIGLTLTALFLSEVHVDGFFTFHSGWYAGEHNQNWLVFWLLNWGVVPLLALISWIIEIQQAKKKILPFFLYAPFFTLFVLCNLISFQPFLWDNTKLLAWTSVGFSLLTAMGLLRLWRAASKKIRRREYFSTLKYLGLRSIVSLIFVATIFSGGIDAVSAIQFQQHQYQMYSSEELELAEWVKENTPSNSIWLTSDQHNHWLPNLTGRQIVMAYRGWLWSHGYTYSQVEQDVKTMFTQPEDMRLFQTYDISYVVIGPSEIVDWGADGSTFSQFYTPIHQTQHYVILRLHDTNNSDI